MNKNLKIRLLADSGMTLALLLLMSYQLVGEKAHEWIGMAMFLLVIGHHVLHDISGDRRIYHAASGILHRADHTVPFPGKYSRSVETCASLYNRCLINDILKREVQITENRLLLERVKNETGMYRTISENYDKQKKKRT